MLSGILICTLLNSCIELVDICGPLDLNGVRVDPYYFTPAEFRYWQAAEDRIYAATGLQQFTYYQECYENDPYIWCAVKARELGYNGFNARQGITECNNNVIRIMYGIDRESMTILHEFIHALGVRGHTTSRSILNATLNNGADCITQTEIDLICQLQPCQWSQPEVCPNEN